MQSLFVKDGYPIVRCLDCGLERVHPMPAETVLEAHYQDKTYFHGDTNQGYRDYMAMRPALVPLAQRRLHSINALVATKGRLLDFGCAAGIFLEVAKDDGWEVAGVELSSDMAASARERLGVHVVQDPSELPGAFDAITMWEVIEHLPRPLMTLTALRERMPSGGLLMLSTPNTGHWQAQQDPEAWEGYRPPSHLLFFNSDTLRATLAQAGFRDVIVERTAPTPPLPAAVRSWTRPLQQGLADGSARPWRLALYAWRMVRLFGIVWQRLSRPEVDIYATLVARARKQ